MLISIANIYFIEILEINPKINQENWDLDNDSNEIMSMKTRSVFFIN